MKFRFNHEKNRKLLEERGINFDQVADHIKEEKPFFFEKHPNSEKYPNQKLLYLPLEDEVYVIPCVREEDGTYFLKTIFPSRKARKKFLEPALKTKKPRT